MNLAPNVPTFTLLAGRMDRLINKPCEGWSVDYEHYDNVGPNVYFVFDESGFTVATCRLLEHAEQIVRDHNRGKR